MKKLYLLVILIVSMTVLFFALGITASAETYGDLTYEVSNGEITITDCNESATEVEIPAEIDGYPVTHIGVFAFSGCRKLTNVTIPDSVTIIAGGAFTRCSGLISVTIPDSVTGIGASVFFECTALESVTIGNSVPIINVALFSGCTELTSITIPDSVTSIEISAFENCTGLTSVTIPDSVTNIGKTAFYNCKKLKKVTIPDSVTSIGESAFSGCTTLTNITIPDSVASIGKAAFSGCIMLTDIIISDSVVNVGNEAFYNTAYYNNIANWDNNVLYISNHLIKARKSIMGPYVIKQGTVAISDYAFVECEWLTEISIPDSVKIIGFAAFGACTGLTSVVIPNSVTSIGMAIFERCVELESIVISASVESIPAYTFRECIKLVNVIIPDSVRSIGSCAFTYCNSLTGITIPDSVTIIEDSAFSSCTLNDVYYGGTVLQWNNISIGRENDELQNAAIHFEKQAGESEITTGDANGDYKITAADARIALRISAKVDNFEDYNLTVEALDVTGDGKLTAADARKILRVAAKIDTLDNNESVVPAADFERLKEILLQTLNEPFDYKNNDAEYIVEHVLYDDVWAFGYQIYSDEILILYDNYWGNDDPDPYGRFGCYFILDAETVKWICEEIYHVECNETEYNSDNSYFYNGKLYLGCSGPVGLDGGLWVDLNSYTVNPEGKYEIIAKKYYESNLIGTYSILAEWTEIDGEYLWTFYSIEKI